MHYKSTNLKCTNLNQLTQHMKKEMLSERGYIDPPHVEVIGEGVSTPPPHVEFPRELGTVGGLLPLMSDEFLLPPSHETFIEQT